MPGHRPIPKSHLQHHHRPALCSNIHLLRNHRRMLRLHLNRSKFNRRNRQLSHQPSFNLPALLFQIHLPTFCPNQQLLKQCQDRQQQQQIQVKKPVGGGKAQQRKKPAAKPLPKKAAVQKDNVSYFGSLCSLCF